MYDHINTNDKCQIGDGQIDSNILQSRSNTLKTFGHNTLYFDTHGPTKTHRYPDRYRNITYEIRIRSFEMMECIIYI